MRSKLLATTAIGAASIISLSSCSTTSNRVGTFGGPIPPSMESPTGSTSPQEEQEYRDISTLYSRGAYEAALLKLQTFEKKHPKSPLNAQIENLHGLCDLLTKRPAQSIPHFQRAVNYSRNSPAIT